MKKPLLLLLVAGALCVLALPRGVAPAQQIEEVQLNPDIAFPPGRTPDGVNLSVREARQRVYEAITLEAQGEREKALDKWREAYGRYESLRAEYLKEAYWGNAEILVRSEYPVILPRQRDNLFTETWEPLVDHINGTFRDFEWPKMLRDRLATRQQAAGTDMLARALERDDHTLLRRCARFYQFSDAGRTALRMLADRALESGDALMAVRWLEELRKAWPEQFNRDPMLNMLLVRATRESGARHRGEIAMRRIERDSVDGEVDVGGRSTRLRAWLGDDLGPAPAARPELRQPGWRTAQGSFDRNRVAPPITNITGMVNLGSDEANRGYKVGVVVNTPVEDDPWRGGYSSATPPAVPVLFPSTHESGFFLHRPQQPSQDEIEQLLWFRHGRESSPVQLEIPKQLRYAVRKANQGGSYYWGGQRDVRARHRVLASSIGRLRWDLDQRESDVLFAVMGLTSPGAERPSEPTGNQIQAFDLAPDASRRVTLPNNRVETEAEFNFLKHVTFMGAPVIHDNKLYIAGAVPETSSIEFWTFCFDVTPKGDPAAGEGKLLWRTHCCSLALKEMGWGPRQYTLPEMTSLAASGGMLYLSTHNGGIAGIDRNSGEIAWVVRYRRPGSSQRGWFSNHPIMAGGYLIAANYDSITSTGDSAGSELALVLDGITGLCAFEYPRRGRGYKGEYEHVLGVVDNRMIIQGRTRLHCIALPSHRQGRGPNETDQGELIYQSADFGNAMPRGRGLIAGDRILVPFETHIAIYDAGNGKQLGRHELQCVKFEGGPVTLTAYCRGEAYKDEDGLTRYRPVTVTDPDTGNVYCAEHLPNGSEFTFPSGKTAKVVKETFLIMASSAWVYVFTAE